MVTTDPRTAQLSVPAGGRDRRRIWAVLAIAVYIALSVAVYLPVAPWSSGTLPYCNCGDTAMTASFLAWTPFAILHGHNPFFTNYQYFPAGANLASNTTMPVLGLLLTPITLTAGPIASLNVALRLAFASSAVSAFFVARRYVRRLPLAFVAGLLYGFSPYMVSEGEVHLNLIFVPLLPVLLLLADELLVRQSWQPRRVGILLGLVAAGQYYLSSEVLADAVIVGLIGTVLLAIRHRRRVRERVRYVWRAILVAIGVFVPLVAYPVYMVLAGPEHLSGPVRKPDLLSTLHSDLLSLVVPTTRDLLSFGPLGVVGSGYVNGNAAENGAYLGIPLLVVLGWLCWSGRSRPGSGYVRWLLALAGVAYLLSLGAYLDVGGHFTHVPLPAWIFPRLPLLNGVVAVRFAVYAFLFVAMALAIGLDRYMDSSASATAPGKPPRAPRAWGARAPAAWRAAAWRAALLAAVALIPLLPSLPYGGQPDGYLAYDSYQVPPFFGGGGGAGAIPSGTPVLVYPFGDPANTAGLINYAVLWQAVAGFRFEILDGDASRPGPGGYGTEAGPALQPFQLQELMYLSYFGPVGRYQYPGLADLDPPGPQVLAQVRAALARAGVSTVVADPVGIDPALFESVMTAALGRPPVLAGGVYAWFDVRRDLAGR